QKNDDDAERYTENIFYNTSEPEELIRQNIIREMKGFSWEASASYTEPVGKRGMVELEYEVGNRRDDSDQLVYDMDEMGNRIQIDTAFSNTFNSNYLAQEAEIGYQYTLDKFQLQVETEFQHAQLKNDQEFPNPFALTRTFRSILPS